jgi:hypothetical protein
LQTLCTAARATAGKRWGRPVEAAAVSIRKCRSDSYCGRNGTAPEVLNLRDETQRQKLRIVSVGGTVEPIPGSLLDLASVAAAPEEFAFGPWSDAWASLPDVKALAIHSRVIRWSLDEFAPPASLTVAFWQRSAMRNDCTTGNQEI